MQEVHRIFGVAAVAALAALALVLAVQSPASTSRLSSGGTFTLGVVNTNGAYSNLDLTKNGNAGQITSLGLDLLMQSAPISQGGGLKPWLAQSVTHPNPVTYIYHLRHGVRFWDGSELTSADVVTSWKYESSGATSSFVFTGASFKSVRAGGRYTVIVTLKKPNAVWAHVPAEAQTEIFEKKFWEAHKATFGHPGTMVVGTGPYEFESFDPTRGAELSANPHYWRGKVPFQHISIKFFSSETNEALAFRSGDLDATIGVSDPNAFASTAGSSARIITGPSCAWGYFAMNTLSPGWSDVHVRRAVAYALNRQDIIKAMGIYATPVSTFILPNELRLIGSPQAVSNVVKSLPTYPFSVAKAKQELAQSAYPNGFSVTLPIQPGWSNASGTAISSANQVVAAELQQIGIKAQLKSGVTYGEYYAGFQPPASGRWAATFDTEGCTSFDPSENAWLLGAQNAKTGYNIANYTPPVVDNLLAAGTATSSPAKRLAIYGQLLKRLAIDSPYIPLFNLTSVTAISSKVSWPTYDYLYFDRSWGLDIKPR
jgi:peptide/nickel transport system substrate-binding protein